MCIRDRRLASQLSDTVAAAVIKEANSGRLHQYFTGSDFAFFDTQGNFIGENLKVSEEILYKVRNTFVEMCIRDRTYSEQKTPILIHSGALYGSGIDNIHLMENELVMKSKLPLIILYPATQEGDRLMFLNTRPASKYRCMIVK